MFFLTHILNTLCFVGGVSSGRLASGYHHTMLGGAILFLLFFLTFIVHALMSSNFTMGPSARRICVRPFGCFAGFVRVPIMLVLFLVKIMLILFKVKGAILGGAFSGKV